MKPYVYAVASGAYPRIGQNSVGHKLRKMMALFEQKKINKEELVEIQNAVAKEIILEQINAGLDIVTDGLVRWSCPISHIGGRMQGVLQGALHHFLDTNFHVRKAVVTSLPEWSFSLLADEIRYAKTVTEKPIKAVFTGPATFLMYAENYSSHTLEKIGLAYAEALSQELEVISSLGVSVLHIDDPCLLRSVYSWQYLQECYACIVSSAKNGIITELKTYGSKAASYLHELFKFPCDYIGLDCVADRRLISRIIQAPEILNGKGIAVGILDARKSVEEDPLFLEIMIEPLLLYASRPLFLEATSGLEYLPRSFAQKKCEAVTRTKQALINSSLYQDIQKHIHGGMSGE